MLPRSAKPQIRMLRAVWSFVWLAASLAVCLSAGPVAAQPGPPLAQPGAHLTFQSLTRADGLAHPSVRSILQDQQGFMWFGTNAGLNRYDGYRFTFFDGQPDVSFGPGVVNVVALAKDNDGVVW